MQRQAWRVWLTTVDVRRLVFLDETGAKTNMTRLYARARYGARAVDHAPCGRWRTTTLVAAINSQHVLAPMALDGPMDGSAFEAWVEQMLLPALPPDSIVVMDNLSVHKMPHIIALCERAGIAVRFLPPYSPDFNPIELMWSKVKACLRRIKARTPDDLLDAIAVALNEITLTDLQGFFQHSVVGVI